MITNREQAAYEALMAEERELARRRDAAQAAGRNPLVDPDTVTQLRIVADAEAAYYDAVEAARRQR